MAWKAIHMFVIILACSHLIISSSTPVSRTRHLFHERQQSGAVRTTKQMASSKATGDDSTQGGVEFQLNDYAPAGANPFHTPRPPHA
ncbi:hypothetical protein AKJ16_DCAP10324 [Drosera capensis]